MIEGQNLMVTSQNTAPEIKERNSPQKNKSAMKSKNSIMNQLSISNSKKIFSVSNMLSEKQQKARHGGQREARHSKSYMTRQFDESTTKFPALDNHQSGKSKGK